MLQGSIFRKDYMMCLRIEVSGSWHLRQGSAPSGPCPHFCFSVQNFRSWSATGVAPCYPRCLRCPTWFQKHAALETAGLPAIRNTMLRMWSHIPVSPQQSRSSYPRYFSGPQICQYLTEVMSLLKTLL